VPLQSDITGTPRMSLNLGNGQSLNLAQGNEIAVRSPMNSAASVDLANTPLVRRLRRQRAGRNWDDFRASTSREAPRRPHQRPRF
jgi:hypothetical protein